MAIIKLKQPALWALDSGLAALGDLLSLARYEDMFDDFIIDAANIGALTVAAGSITEAAGLVVYTPANADATIWYYKTPLVINQADVITARAGMWNVNSTGWPFMVKQGEPAIPAIDGENPVIEAILLIGDVFRVRRRDAAGAFEYWNETTGAWQAGVINLPSLIDYGHAFAFRLIKSATSWTLKITDINTDTVMCDTSAAAAITWADTYDNGNDYFISGGDPVTTGTLMSMNVISLITSYPLTAQMATHGQLDVYAAFEQFPITQVGDVVWEYNKDGAGWIQPGAGAPADLEAALSGMYIKTIDVRATLSSDSEGDAAASFDINGGVLAGPVRLPRYGVRQ